MSSSKKLADFPDVEAKLQKPSKQSAFEKQKADAEAKRKREAAETAAVYESFVKSFDHDDDHDNSHAEAPPRRNFQQGGPFARSAGNPPFGAGGAPRRHFGGGGPGGQNMKSGPGSLGPAPTAFGKKKYDGFQQGHNRRAPEEARGRLGFDDDSNTNLAPKSKAVSKAFNTSDDEEDSKARDIAEERAVAKPTLRLANLPPGTSPAVIKVLMPANMIVDQVKILPLGASSGTERKSMTAIVTLSKETPAADMDAAVSSLQNKYLGYGFYLSLHRHLSSAVTSTTASSTLGGSSTSHAFGAKPVPQANESRSHQPGGFHRGFAPPSSYGPGLGPMQRTILHVPVRPPSDIKQLQLIHKVIESVLEHGPEFEALLMSRPDVQREERWAWLWDARSTGGVWYRWRLWEVITGAQASAGKQGKYIPLFEGSHAWKMPEKPLAYEYTTAIDEFISDPEYNSSDDEDFEDEGIKPAEGGEHEITYLNPLDKAKLTHLLARLPKTLGSIRKGDIARITTFAITHASRGADEIVDMVVSNIVHPFALTSANPDYHKSSGDGGDERAVSQDLTPLPDGSNVKSNMVETQDTSALSLVALYAASDLLSSSATSGVRHAWRYRQLFEGALKRNKVFETLGLLPERLSWGRLRAEKWKRSIGLVLGLWEGWCAFPNDSQQFFMQTFENPPSAKKEEKLEDTGKKAGKWKAVEAGPRVQNEETGFLPVATRADGDDGTDKVEMSVEDVDGEAMDMTDVELDSDIDGVPMDDVPMDDGEETGEPMDQDEPGPDEPGSDVESGENRATPTTLSKPSDDTMPPTTTRPLPKRRIRAVDMFADSDDSEGGR
ncbi:hypothetical protein F4778DRAFT_504943 [Xylariomycetidae sp. FL2044]|nr:hypothetical protein F4778DRAFT_504943 [Xylariomycetidae sp. FL2044]